MRNQDRLLLALAIALSGGVAAGCHESKADVLGQIREAVYGERGAQSGGKVPGDRYLAMRGRTAEPGTAFVQAPPDTWAPFDVSVRTGLFDPERMATADGARVCLELSTVDFAVYYDVCADYAAASGTWTVFAFHGAPATSLPGAVELAGPEIELRTETDGTTLRFHAREAGAEDFAPVSELPFPPQASPLKAAVGGTNLRKGTVVGFDDPSYTSAGPPLPLSAEADVAADTNACLLAGLAAFLALDGAAPDFSAASAALADATLGLASARSGADSLAPSPTAKKVRRRLDAAGKSLAKADRDVAEERAERALGRLAKAGRQLVLVSLLLSPQPAVGTR
jgi:hypothetical protein